MKYPSLFLFFMLGQILSFGQVITGQVVNAEGMIPMAFVNIGVVGMDIGTVSDAEGAFQLTIGEAYDEEVLRFSYLGFEDVEIVVKEFKKRDNYNVALSSIAYDLQEIVVTPYIIGHKTLGHTGNTKMTTAGFGEYKLGFEHAVRMDLAKNEKALIENININIARCSFDSLHYRVNIYHVEGKKNITSVLKRPIYVKFAKRDIKDQISFNLEDEQIIVTGDFLVSLEHVKDLGEGEVAFSTDPKKKTYVRKTSQGKWKVVKTGISISADVSIIK